MRIAILGRTRMLLQTAERMADAGHHLVAVITAEPAPEYSVGVEDFKRLADAHAAPFLNTQRINHADALMLLQRSRPDIGVSVNWPSRIDARTIDCFPFGILNAHAGDLPRYRGNAPIAWAILNDEREIGVCIHQMDAEQIDAGPVVVRERIPIAGRYIGELMEQVELAIPDLFAEAVKGIGDGSVIPRPQLGPALTGYSRRPEDGAIRWMNGAEAIHRLVRASAEPFAGAFCQFNGKRLTVWRARVQKAEPTTDIDPLPTRMAVHGQVVAIAGTTVAIECGGYDLIELQEVQPEGGSRQPAASLIRSLRDRLHDG